MQNYKFKHKDIHNIAERKAKKKHQRAQRHSGAYVVEDGRQLIEVPAEDELDPTERKWTLSDFSRNDFELIEQLAAKKRKLTVRDDAEYTI